MWNADESVFSRLRSGWSRAAFFPGHKSDKTCMKFFACFNCDGSEKFHLTKIGIALKRRPFKKMYGHDPRFYFYANRKDWMT